MVVPGLASFPGSPFRSLVVLFVAGLATWAAAGDGRVTTSREPAVVIPGLTAPHGLEPAQAGEVLFVELRCAACHAARAERSPIPGPDLSEVGARLRPTYLEAFLRAPQTAHPGSRMPDLLSALSEGERGEVSKALTHWLVSRATQRFRSEPADASDVAEGGRLFHRVGCVACHEPRMAPPSGGSIPDRRQASVPLDHVGRKYGVDSLAAFLFEPGRVRPAGRMPDLALSRAEARSIAAYLIGMGSEEEPAFELAPALVQEGERQFERFNCHACHAGMIEAAPRLARPRAELRGEAGCLDPQDGATPRFALAPMQIAALRTALPAPGGSPTPAQALDRALVSFNCIGCHERDGHGGVDPALDPYFETSARDLGDEARIPPPLTDVGAKLQPGWMRKILFDGARARPTMHTRMPQFGESNLGELPEGFAAVDAGSIEPFPIRQFRDDGEDRERDRAREAGRQLLGSSNASCISCHDFNGKPASPGFRGTDLILTTERLQPSWFARFLMDPQAFRPRMVMPTFWLDGQAVQTEILDGDTRAQIEAIWSYLAQGRVARDPEGVNPVRTHIDVTDTIRTYRGRSRVAGFRGIAVGFPGGVNYAFDARNGALAALWRGDFVSARWDGQGAGDFEPRAPSIQLERDLPFSEVLDAVTPWPRRPRTSEEQPVDPDPTYPKRLGYQFQGYHLDAARNPTLRYRFGSTQVEDRSAARLEGQHPALRRTLRFVNEQRRFLHFLLLTGEVEVESETSFLQGRLRVRLSQPVPMARREVDGQRRELLLVLDLPEGFHELQIDYELLP